jgi:WD40 repeat protein
VGRATGVRAALFSPDGKRIVIASDDTRTAQLWDAETGKHISVLDGQHVSSAAFSPDGKRIVTGSDDDNTARLWDTETGKPIGELKVHGNQNPVLLPTTAAFSPDGRRIVTVSLDRTVRLWKIFANTQELVSHAKANIPRCLTAAQRNAFFLPPDPPQWCIELEKRR